jgi:CRISPR-associated protein Csm2
MPQYGRQDGNIRELSPQEKAQVSRIFADDKELISLAQILGKKAKEGRLQTSQLRAVFGEVRRIEMMLADENKKQQAWYRLRLLEPKMLYRAARKESSSEGLQELTAYLKQALQCVLEAPEESRKDCFQRFLDFLEAVVAYHKAAGGGD